MKVFKEGDSGEPVLVGECSYTWTRGGRMPPLVEIPNSSTPYFYWETAIVGFVDKEDEYVIRLRRGDDPRVLPDWRAAE